MEEKWPLHKANCTPRCQTEKPPDGNQQTISERLVYFQHNWLEIALPSQISP